MRNYLLGRTTWAYPWMRWFGVPMTRIGLVLVGGSIAVSGHSGVVTAIGAGLLVSSILVDSANYAILRTRRRGKPAAY